MSTNTTIKMIPIGTTVPFAVVNLKILRKAPLSDNADGHDTPNPPQSAGPRPRVIMQVQSVAKNGGKSITATSTPLNTPINTPMPIHARMPTPTGTPWCTIKYPPINA